MDEVTKQIQAPAFWLLSVAVGLALNLVSGYAKDWLDKRFGALSSAWLARSEQVKANFLRKAELLARDQQEMLYALHMEIRLALVMVALLLLVVVLFQIFFSLRDVALAVRMAQMLRALIIVAIAIGATLLMWIQSKWGKQVDLVRKARELRKAVTA